MIALLDRQNKDTAVTNLPGTPGFNDRFHCVIHHFVGDDDLDHDFGQQRDGVFSPAVNGFVTFLAAVTADFGHGHTRDIELGQGILHFFQFVGTNDCFDKFHRCLLDVVI